MELLQKFSLPLSIVIAGALIAGTILYTDMHASSSPVPITGAAQYKQIRSVQSDDHILGSKDAKVVLYEFSDPECPFCKQFHATLQDILKTYDGTSFAWVYRHFPIPQLHPKAPKEAEALECANAQGGSDAFWRFTDKLYETTTSNNSLDDGVYNTPTTVPTDANGKPYYTQKTPTSKTDAGQLSVIAVAVGLDKAQFEDCLAKSTYEKRVQTDYDEAVAAGASGTPTSFLKMSTRLSNDAKTALAQLQAQYGVTMLDDHTVVLPGSIPLSALKPFLDIVTK